MLRQFDNRIISQYVAARRTLNVSWPEYEQTGEEFLDACLWEVARQMEAERRALWGLGDRAPRSPELRRRRVAYLECYRDIAQTAAARKLAAIAS